MGILNVTPDSFADGGRHHDPGRAIDVGLRMVADGADLLDIGGESTRPGAATVDADEELRRVLPVIDGLARQTAVPLSIDTYKASVAQAALDAGASIVNDISGLRHDADLAGVVADRRAAIILMHTRGRSQDMYAQADYGDVVADVVRELADSVATARQAGIDASAIAVDPGIGFAKRASQSFEVLARLDNPAWAALDYPLLVGPSRKSFLQEALGARTPDDREWGTAAAVTAAVLAGAHIVRVHGVKEMVQVVRVADKIRWLREPS